MSNERIEELSRLIFSKNSDRKTIVDELSLDECILISNSEAEANLNDQDGDCYRSTAFYTLNNTDICFQAILDGDYNTLSELKSPYDNRDGKFFEFRDKRKFVFKLVS